MSTPLSPRRSGFTLIEVAVALALFVIGALAIVRIFPPALGVIRNNESRATAVSLGESTLARLRGPAAGAPDGVFDVVADSTEAYNWQDYPVGIVTSASKSNTLPKQPTDAAYDVSALSHFRYIYGETHRLKSGQEILFDRPVDSTTASDLTAPNDLPRVFYDSIIGGVQIGEDGYLDFSSAYVESSEIPDIDAGYGYDVGRTFHDTANPQNPPTNARTTNTAAPDSATTPSTTVYYVSYHWRESTTPSIIQGVQEEPIAVRNTISVQSDRPRVFPYFINSANKVIPGVVQVRVRRYPPVSVTGTGTADSRIYKFTAPYTGTYHFNYLSSDWRTMTDDFSATDIQDYLDDLFGKNGATLIDQHANGLRTRGLYTTADNWAQQLSVAARSYIPYNANRGTTSDYPREPWREYSWDSSDSSMMYFHPSDAGKTIAISFMNGTTKVSSVCTIDEDLIAKPGSVPSGFIGPGNTDSKVARLFITDAAGLTPSSVDSILSVQGLSIRARTAWLNNDRYNQVIVPGYRTLTQSNS
jgi:prepilin-type N-terminal cleavage/methylation domain-containing protein